MPEVPDAQRPTRLPALTDGPAPPATLEEAREIAGGISRSLRRAARKARTPAGIVSGGGGLRARRGDRAFRTGFYASFVVCVLVPLIAASVYWGLIASNQYAAEVKFAVRAGQSSPLDALGGMFGLGASQAAQDTQIVAGYIESRAMVDALDRTLDLRRMYSRQDVDYLSRFDADEPIEKLEKYWRKHVTVKIENLSGIIEVNVRAFTANDSLALAREILRLSEALVNDLSARSRHDALAQARSELERAEKRLQATSSALREARNVEHVLDAKAAAESLDKIISILRLEQLRLKQDLSALPNNSTSSPQAQLIKIKINSIKAQIEEYSSKIAGHSSESGRTLADRLQNISGKQLDLDLAQQQYAQASAIFQNARVNLETQQAYLVTSTRPTMPQQATYPRRWWEWSIIVMPCLGIWASLIAVAFLVRDNMAK